MNNKILGYGMRRSWKKKNNNERGGYEFMVLVFDGKVVLESVVLEFICLKLVCLFWLFENYYMWEKIR